MAKKQPPPTSVDAYHSLDPEKLNDIFQKILNALHVIGKGTFEDISKQLKLPRERVWKRLPDLAKMDLVYKPGERKLLKSGREGFVWALTATGKTKVTEKALEGESISDFSKKLIPAKNQQPITTNTLF